MLLRYADRADDSSAGRVGGFLASPFFFFGADLPRAACWQVTSPRRMTAASRQLRTKV